MARASCKVKLKQFKWNRSGYGDVLRGEVADLCEKKARALCNAANAGVHGSGGYSYMTFPGKLGRGGTVITSSSAGRYDNAKRNTLRKLIGGVRV